MRKFRFGWMLLLGVLLSLALVGCSSEDSSKSDSGSGDEKVKLTFWGDWTGDGEDQFNHMVEKFNESQDRIEVEYVIQEDLITKFMTGITSGQVPDVLLWDRWRTSLYAPKGVLHPINEYMEADGVSEGDFYEEALKELSYDDNLYGLPLTVDTRALFYNKDHFEEAGIEPPTTWEELREAAKKLTVKNGKDFERVGFSLNDLGLFNMWLQQAGGQMLTEDLTATAYNSEAGLKVLEYWNQLLFEDEVYKTGFDKGLEGAQHPFVTGKSSMHFTGPWDLRTYEQYSDQLNYGVVPPPAGPNGDKGAVMGGFGLAVPEASEKKEAAWEFIKWWLAEPENALEWGKTSLNIPGNKIALEDPFFQDDPFWKPFIDSLEFAKIRPRHPGYSVAEVDALIPNLEKFLLQEQSAEETLEKAQKEGDRMLKENEVE
ncbi:ABC transporter substrate-binding protein [Metabacillus halosaccharovorans]|uniref:ABC transporter substrate-binding protein n=1 Tax=Metabacillus halosaccharovorans TaxID=930124 RepID=UPI0034CF4EBE